MKKLVTIGEILVEIMAVEPGEGFRQPIPLVGPFASGAPAIFIDQAARLGQPCAIVSCVGNDDFGRMCVDRLRRDGVDVSGIGLDRERPTGSAFVRYRPDGARDFVFNIRHSACSSTTATTEVEALLESADHLHVMGTSLFSDAMVQLTMSAISRIRTNGGTISFDPNLRREMIDLPGLREALDFVCAEADLLMPSGSELFLLANAGTEAAAVHQLLGRRAKAVVLKRGLDGASYFDADGEISAPAHRVDEVDPTGAGDCFGATFVCCWLRNMPPKQALAYANASGALAVRKRGPMEGTSSLAEIAAFIGEGAHS
jgi:sugar/nucleoside kinase (ribokinase family)